MTGRTRGRSPGSLILLFILVLISSNCRAAEPGKPLDFIVIYTGGAGPSDTLPTLVAIHGLGSAPEEFSRLFTSYKPRLRVVLPRGPIPHGSGASWFRTVIEDGVVKEISQEELQASVESLASLIKDLPGRFPTCGKVLVTGFSQGGVLSYGLALKVPELLGMVFPLSGYLPEAMLISRERPHNDLPQVFALHGADDRLVGAEGAGRTVDFLVKSGYQASLRSFPGTGHRISGLMRQILEGRLLELSLDCKTSAP